MEKIVPGAARVTRAIALLTRGASAPYSHERVHHEPCSQREGKASLGHRREP